MNILPIFQVLHANADVRTVFDMRIYEDIAPSDARYPYAVWSTIGGEPDNTLADAPVVDRQTFQLVVYSNYATSASEGRKLIASILEDHCTITGIHSNYFERVGDQNIFGRGFDGSWWMNR